MKIRQLIDISGTIDGTVWPGKGEVLDLADHVAADLIANGYAEQVASSPKREIAAADPAVETAAIKPAARRAPKA